jgi:signal transduction histidine kinase
MGTLVGVGALVIMLVAAVAIAIERWQEETASLVDTLELAAFDLSETRTPRIGDVAVRGATDVLIVLLDENAEVIDSSGSSFVGLDALIDGPWTEAVEQDTVITFEFGDFGGASATAAAVPCIDRSVCDTAIVVASEGKLSTYLAVRWMWLAGPALLAGAGAAGAAVWLVGRSLRPVDAMRRDLASITASDLERRVPVPSTGDELERLGTTLNETIDRLGAAIAANERFVADAAHELRSPITGVRAAIDLEAGRSPGGLLDDSARELERASRLIDDLLVLARRQGRGRRIVDVDLDDVVREQIGMVATRFPEVELTASIVPVRLSGDPDGLRRVVENLVDNACFYGDRRVGISLESVDGVARLRIDDDGPGIPVAERERVFERFARLDGSRSRHTGGSGLGLAIVEELVGEHDGTTAIEDSPWGGASVVVTLPLIGG